MVESSRADLQGALVQRRARRWSWCFSSPPNHTSRCSDWFFELSCDPPHPRGEEFWLGFTQAVFYSDRDGIPFLRRPARCSRQLTPMRYMCRCRARGSAAQSQSWRFCSTPCDGVEHFAGVVCMISWLRGAGRRHPPCQDAFRSCMRVFAASNGSAKPATLRSLVGGLAGGEISGRQLSGLAIGFCFQGSSPCTRRVRPRHVTTRLSCTIMR